METGHAQKTNHVTRGWRFEPHDISTQISNGGRAAADWIPSGQWHNPSWLHSKPSRKTLDTEAQVSFQLVTTSMCWEGDSAWLDEERTRKLYIWDPFRPFSLGLFFWLVLICILQNNTVSALLSSLSHSSELTNEGVVDIPKFIANCSASSMDACGWWMKRRESLKDKYPWPLKSVQPLGSSCWNGIPACFRWPDEFPPDQWRRSKQTIFCLLLVLHSPRGSQVSFLSAVSLGKAVAEVLVPELILMWKLGVCLHGAIELTFWSQISYFGWHNMLVLRSELITE